MNADTPDQYASGDGGRWSVARYGTLVVTTYEHDSDDEQFADEAAAQREFDNLVASLTGQ